MFRVEGCQGLEVRELTWKYSSWHGPIRALIPNRIDLRRLPEGRGTSDESCIIGVLKSVRCCGMGLERLTGGG